jgi:hypothetical protein
MVLINGMKYSPEDQSILRSTTTRISFPSLTAARQATKYIDKPYSVKAGQEKGKAFLEATAPLPYGAATEEFDAFRSVASKFGGRVECVTNDG